MNLSKSNKEYWFITFIILILTSLIWCFGNVRIWQGIDILLLFILITFWYIEPKKLEQYFMIIFFSLALFITVYLILGASLGISHNELKKEVKIYALIGGTFFWSGVLTYIIMNLIMKSNGKEWLIGLKSLGVVLLKMLIVLFSLVIMWTISFYIWKTIHNVAIARVSAELFFIIFIALYLYTNQHIKFMSWKNN